jgi:hypothetical protein
MDDAELHAWYEAADLFVHPTLYEGSLARDARGDGGRHARAWSRA